MSKRGVAARQMSRDSKGSGAKASPAEPAPEPLKRRPRLFTALLVFFAIWIGLLLALYMRTVYPMRYPSTDAATATRPGASALPSAPR